MPDLIVKQGDTYPPVVSALLQNGALIDLTAATLITFAMKGSGALVTGTATKLTVVTPTATAAIGSPVLTAVSSFTNVVIGGSITDTGGKVPPNARVIAFDSVAGTITMGDNTGAALNALGSGSGITLTINKGCVSYPWGTLDTSVADSYNAEHKITYPGPVTQRVPNSGFNTILVTPGLGE